MCSGIKVMEENEIREGKEKSTEKIMISSCSEVMKGQRPFIQNISGRVRWSDSHTL